MGFLVVFLTISVASRGFGLEENDDHFIHDFSTDGATGLRQSQHNPIRTITQRQQLHVARHRRAGTPQALDGLKSTQFGLQSLFNKIPDQVKPEVNHIWTKLGTNIKSLNSTNVGNNLGKLQKVTETFTKNWDKLTGRDPAAIASAICELTGSVSGFIPPPAGTIISTLMALASNILGIFAEKPKSIAEIMKEVVRKELRDQYVHEMKGEIRGAITALELNHVFLSGYKGGNLTDRDFQFMLRQFDMLTHIQLRGNLAYQIESLSKTTDPNEAKDAITFLDRYAELTSMVELLMHTMKSILEEDKQTQMSATNLGLAIKAVKQETAMDLQPLRTPKKENALLVAMYDPAAHPSVEAVLNNLETTSVSGILEKNQCYKLVGKYKDNGKMNTYTAKAGKIDNIDYVTAEYGTTTDGIFRFDKNANEKFWSITAANKPVCASGTDNNLEIGKPCKENKGQFRIHAFVDGGYMIVNQHRPTSPLWIDIITKPLYWIRVISSRQKEWTKADPEYLWDITAAPCPKQ